MLAIYINDVAPTPPHYNKEEARYKLFSGLKLLKVSKKYLNKSLLNRSARIILFNIYPRLINKASLLKRNDHPFNYFRFIFIS
jgi:hypothetical protein